MSLPVEVDVSIACSSTLSETPFASSLAPMAMRWATLPSKPIELGDYKRITLPCIIDCSFELSPMRYGRDLLGEDLVTAGGLQRLHLSLVARLLIDGA